MYPDQIVSLGASCSGSTVLSKIVKSGFSRINVKKLVIFPFVQLQQIFFIKNVLNKIFKHTG